jgi:glucose/mannose-6-phosphate isomerase
MDKKDLIESLDRGKLREVILSFPQQFSQGFALAKDLEVATIFSAVTASGMGGSSLPIDIIQSYLDEKREVFLKPITIAQNRTYKLPKEAYLNALNLFISYSGNTEETISALEEAIEKKLPAIGLATGGKLIEICQKNNLPYIIIPTGLQPRYATGYFFGAILSILTKAGFIKDIEKEILEEAKKLEKLPLALEAEGQTIGESLKGLTPIVYASDRFRALAMIWKIKLNENAKTPAFWNYFPELNHNEMVGFSLPQAKFHVLMLKDESQTQIKKRMAITAELFKEKGIATTFIKNERESFFQSLFGGLILGDWISFYLSLAYGQDPTPVKMVEDLKKRLV